MQNIKEKSDWLMTYRLLQNGFLSGERNKCSIVYIVSIVGFHNEILLILIIILIVNLKLLNVCSIGTPGLSTSSGD